MVPTENGPHILDRLGTENKQPVWLDNSYHVAILDKDKDLIAKLTLRFIRENGG